MTTETLEQLLAVALPEVRRKVKQSSRTDDDHCQEAMIDLHTKAHTFPEDMTQEQFTSLFFAYYYTRRRMYYSRWFRAMRRGNYLGKYGMHKEGLLEQSNGDELDQKADRYETTAHQTDDPWSNPQIDALEYIELAKNPRTKHILQLHYVMGYTLEEIGSMVGCTPQSVFKTLKRGVARIQKALALITKT